MPQLEITLDLSDWDDVVRAVAVASRGWSEARCAEFQRRFDLALDALDFEGAREADGKLGLVSIPPASVLDLLREFGVFGGVRL